MTTVTEQESPAKKRGRESALDMVRSLGLVLIIVVVVWFFAQPNDEDEQEIRVIDPGPSIASLLRSAPGTPVPTAVPAGWRPTVSDGDGSTLRVGYVTPDDQYLEFGAAAASDVAFLDAITGKGREVGTFVVDGVTWRQLTGKDETTSLVRTVGASTVVVGGVRGTTRFEDVRTLAAVVEP